MRQIVLISPKFEVNVANARRAAAVFGAEKILVVSPRYTPATGEKCDRKPRPLRMKAYKHVAVEYVESFQMPTNGAQVVIVERLEWATPLPAFEHPENAVYIFGPEDGNVPKWIQEKAKRITFIPGFECLNLAMAVGIVLYDANAKAERAART